MTCWVWVERKKVGGIAMNGGVNASAEGEPAPTGAQLTKGFILADSRYALDSPYLCRQHAGG